MANIITDGSTFQGPGSVFEDGNSGGAPPSSGQAVPNGAGAPTTPPPGPDNPQAAEALRHVVAQTQPAASPATPASPQAGQTPPPSPSSSASSGSSFRSPTVTPSFFTSGSQGHNQQTGFPGGPYSGGEIGLAEAQYAAAVQQTFRAHTAAQVAQQAIQSGNLAQAAQIMRENPNVGVTVNGGAAVYGVEAAQAVTQQAGRAVTPSQPYVDVASLGEPPPIPSGMPRVGAMVTPLSAANAPGFSQAAPAQPAVDVASLGEAPAAPTLNHQASHQPASGRAAGNLLSAADIAALGAPPPAPSTSASTLIAGRTGADHAAQRRAEINQQAANVVDTGAFIREHGLPPLAPGMRPDPEEASLYGVRMIIDTTGINPGGTDLGRAVARQALLQYGLTATEADLYLQSNPETRYRSDHGTGAALSDAELRERVASGRIDNTMTAAFVQRIEAFRNDLAVRAMSTSMSAAEQTDAQRWVGTATNYIDRGTGWMPDYIGNVFNQAAVGLIHGVGDLAAVSAGLQRTVNDGLRAVLPEAVGELLTAHDERNRQTVAALQGAQSEVTAENSLIDRIAADNGIRIPRVARLARDLPRLAGELAPSAAAYAPIIAATGGMGAAGALAVNSGLGAAQGYFGARGQGADVEQSAQAGVIGALQSGLVPLAGRYGVAEGVVTNLAATYAVGKAQGLSDAEIETQMMQTLVAEGAFQAGRLRSGRQAASLTEDVRNVVEQVRQSPANEEASRVYRVQGGTLPLASYERVLIGERGEMRVVGDNMLHVTFDDAGRARAYLANNRPGGEIISFEVDPAFVRQVREAAVSQADGRAFPNAPQKADPSKTSNSFGLPAEWIDLLVQSARPGTGRIER